MIRFRCPSRFQFVSEAAGSIGAHEERTRALLDPIEWSPEGRYNG